MASSSHRSGLNHYDGPVNRRNYALLGAVGNTYSQTLQNDGLNTLPAVGRGVASQCCATTFYATLERSTWGIPEPNAGHLLGPMCSVYLCCTCYAPLSRSPVDESRVSNYNQGKNTDRRWVPVNPLREFYKVSIQKDSMSDYLSSHDYQVDFLDGFKLGDRREVYLHNCFMIVPADIQNTLSSAQICARQTVCEVSRASGQQMRGIGTTACTKEQICTSWCNGQVRQHNSLTPWADHTNTPGICAGSTTRSHKEHGLQTADCLWDNSPFVSPTVRLYGFSRKEIISFHFQSPTRCDPSYWIWSTEDCVDMVHHWSNPEDALLRIHDGNRDPAKR
ncbi:hypothetical protein EDD15DRAFT_2204108 [Pisolithus albus]|nr:hypothetical protein EDD15DRAFT_2204108 [Pisolithus albus]